jgi:hypothetical protein
MVAILALNPIRLKNYAALEIDTTFKNVKGQWWIYIPARLTKTRQRPEQRPVATWLNPYIELYLNEARPILLTGSQDRETKALWISSTIRGQMTIKGWAQLLRRQLWRR